MAQKTGERLRLFVADRDGNMVDVTGSVVDDVSIPSTEIACDALKWEAEITVHYDNDAAMSIWQWFWRHDDSGGLPCLN